MQAVNHDSKVSYIYIYIYNIVFITVVKKFLHFLAVLGCYLWGDCSKFDVYISCKRPNQECNEHDEQG
jgi:hypothetical protein